MNVKDELVRLEQLQRDLNKRRAALRAEAIAEAQELIDQFQLKRYYVRFPERSSFPRPGLSRIGRSVSVKYIGPRGERWTGRGRTPRWLVEYESQGRSRKDFLVKK